MTSSAPGRRALAAAAASALVAALALLATRADPPAIVGDLARIGAVPAGILEEASGLAASASTAGVLWAVNDSGNPAVLHALRPSGEWLASVRVTGAANVDWEALAAYSHDGQPYLVIGDIGDNLRIRSRVALHVVEEPALDAPATAPVRTIEFAFPDGPRDAEALAVDPLTGDALILEKRVSGAGLYRLPLDAASPARAERLGSFGPLGPLASQPAQSIAAAFFRGAATAADISADGRVLLVLTYGHALAYRRRADGGWLDVLRRPPRQAARLPPVDGFEAAALDRDGRRAFVTHEGGRAAIHRWDLQGASRDPGG